MVGGILWFCMVLTLNLKKYVGFGNVSLGVLAFFKPRSQRNIWDVNQSQRKGLDEPYIPLQPSFAQLWFSFFPFLCFFTLFSWAAFLFPSLIGQESLYPLKAFSLSVHKEMRRDDLEGFVSYFCIAAEFEQKCCPWNKVSSFWECFLVKGIMLDA